MSNEKKRTERNRRMVTGQLIILIACLAVLTGLGCYVLWQREDINLGPDDAAGRWGDDTAESGDGQTDALESDETETGEKSAGKAEIEESGNEPEAGGQEKAAQEPDALTEQEIRCRQLLGEADRLAAGYDYDAAMALVETYEGFSEVPELMEALLRYENARASAVKYNSVTQITHVFYHSLIVDTTLAFDGDEDAASYNRVMTTVEEFNKIMQEMYDRGYVLVSMHDMGHIEVQADGTELMVAGEIYLPEGKIPYVLSLDDMSYYHYMEGDGFADRMVLDEEGNLVSEYIQSDGTVITGAFDVVPLVEAFVEEHPDAAYRGARGIVALTGYNGVLGYRTDPAYQTGNGLDEEQQAWLAAHPDFDYEKECAHAKAVAEAMREKGWEFACHSYGHLNYKTASYGDFVWDVNTWKNTVESIIGETDIVIFAFGADISDWHPYAADNQKYLYLKETGFDYFCNVDASQYWVQLGSDFLRQGRRNLDGIRMWEAISGGTDRVSDLFDAAAVFDASRPTPVR